MPNIKSAKKRMRSNAKKANVNTLVKSSMKTSIKKVEAMVSAKENKDINNALNNAFQKIDKAKKQGLVHENKAARIKSRLSKAVNSMK